MNSNMSFDFLQNVLSFKYRKLRRYFGINRKQSLVLIMNEIKVLPCRIKCRYKSISHTQEKKYIL